MEPKRYSWDTIFFLSVVLSVAVIAYGPLVGGVWEAGARTTQALNAFVLLGVAFWDGFRTAARAHYFKPTINTHGLFLFGLSCLALAAASLAQVWPLAVLGLCLNIGALLSFCFGRKGTIAFYPALAGFGAMVALLVWVPQLDEWLRLLAGRVSVGILPNFGIRADMVVEADPFQVILVAEKGAGIFNVATECNGFGILLSSVVLALIIALRRRVSWVGVILKVGAAALIGLAFNVIRIVAITMATLRTEFGYGLIHEGLGTVVYLLALTVVYAVSLIDSPFSWRCGRAVPCTDPGA
jgi:exosortase/archaeosortase family protein